VDADVTIYDMEANDMLLLCSDGLTKTVEDEDLAQIMAAPETLATKAKLMVQAANEAGGPDNVTALLIHNNQGGDDND
jgi:protein phosphatase